MTMSYYLIIFMFFSALPVTAQASVLDSLSADTSEVGCFISHQPTNSKNCEKLKIIFAKSRSEYAANPKKFISQLKTKLRPSAQNTNYNYSLILLATLTRNKELLKELKALTQYENKMNFKFKYATQAVDIIEKGQCQKLDKNYQEICEYEDSFFNRINLLNEKKGRSE